MLGIRRVVMLRLVSGRAKIKSADSSGFAAWFRSGLSGAGEVDASGPSRVWRVIAWGSVLPCTV